MEISSDRFKWTESFDNIKEFMMLMQISSFGIEERLNQQD